MSSQKQRITYHPGLRTEAYHLDGICRPFPVHSHPYYTIGCVEDGRRLLFCRTGTTPVSPGQILIFNPGDTHGCIPETAGSFAYSALSIPKETMLRLSEKAAGRSVLPVFSAPVWGCPERTAGLSGLITALSHEHADAGAETNLVQLIKILLKQTEWHPFPSSARETVTDRICAYMRSHLEDRITLEDLSRLAGVSRSTLLRLFAKEKGIAPYRYLELLRIHAAKVLLSEGASPAEAACRTGFYDQSHLPNVFTEFLGIAPGAYRSAFAGRCP